MCDDYVKYGNPQRQTTSALSLFQKNDMITVATRGTSLLQVPLEIVYIFIAQPERMPVVNCTISVARHLIARNSVILSGEPRPGGCDSRFL